ncbi:MAG: hypothetical protein NC124_17520, partial [Clostridium sp.]|nr:hypothetical protein [Clostridium sp.]
RLTDYSATMRVPVNKKWIENGMVANNEYVTIDGTDNKEAEEKKKEEALEKEKKELKKTIVSGVKLTKKKSGKKTKVTIKFSKVKGCKYQIQVANNKSFKSAKKYSVSSNKKTVSVKYKGKKAYVRVRCYKVIDGKTVYGKWSTTKSIKTYK